MAETGYSHTPAPDPSDRKEVSYYVNLIEEEGAQGYVEWINDYLDVQLTSAQRNIIQLIHENQKTLIVAGNGFGKSYVLACFSLAYLFINHPTSVLATSGTYAKLRRTYCRPVEALHRGSYLPGRYLRSTPPRIVIDDYPQTYWEAASPGDPGELEGVHNKYTLAVVEEADKRGVTQEIIDSLESLLTDDNDKIVVVANPPRDEINVVYDLMQPESTWAKAEFSSFESHNVEKELNHPNPYERNPDGSVMTDKHGYPVLSDELEDELIPELVRLNQIKKDWIAWNQMEWPGIEEAKASGEREDLDVRWYRRRLGVMSPRAADVLRPFTVDDVEEAWRREPARITVTPDGLGWDVVRGAGTSGDYNALTGIWGRDMRVLRYWRGKEGEGHLQNEEVLREELDDRWDAPIGIDSVGVGSESPDRVNVFYPHVVRFNSGSNANEPETYANRWTEGLCVLGEYLRDGGSINDERLREELLTAARCVELNEQYSSKYDTTRFKATTKDRIKKRLGRSPDLLDSLYIACLMADDGGDSGRKIPSSF